VPNRSFRAALPVVTLLASAAFAQTPYDGHSVVRLVPRDHRELRTLLALTDDLWSHAAAPGLKVDARLAPEALEALGRTGLRFETLIADVGAAVRAERDRLAAGGVEGGVAGGDPYFDDFRDLAAIEAKMQALAAARPDLVTLETIGTSLEGRPIRAMRISRDPALPAVVFTCTQHAREWISPVVGMAIADALVDGEGVDPRVTAILGRVEVWVIPVVNPDGYAHTWGPERLWRKNRRANGDGSFGVDLNRNWGFQWGGSGASATPSSETYRGPAAFSEPETQLIRDFHLARPDCIASIDFHAYGQLILSPWGYTTAANPQAGMFAEVGSRMKAAIAGETGANYTSGPIASTLYVASGNIVDWAHGERGMVAYTIELRDLGQNGFVLPPSQIEPTVRENLRATFEFLESAGQPAVIAFPLGRPATVAAGAATEVRVVAYPAFGGPAISGVTLHARVAGGGEFAAIPATSLGGGLWSASLPAAPCGATVEWFLHATTSAGEATAPFAGAAAPFAAEAVELAVSFDDDAESDLGWSLGTPGDTATSGQWVRVDPNGTAAQPENDFSPDGTRCFVTGQGPVGGAIGAADVDGGVTTLLSPLLDLSNPDATIRFARWYSNNQGAAPNADSMPIQLSRDGHGWVDLETVSENTNAWVERSFRVADFALPTSNARVRFVARDLGAGSIVEAGVDEFRVVVEGCPSPPGDLDGDGQVGAADLALLLAAWGATGGPADLDGSGLVEGSDLAALLAAWTG
jgi:carboxypeptidase T